MNNGAYYTALFKVIHKIVFMPEKVDTRRTELLHQLSKKCEIIVGRLGEPGFGPKEDVRAMARRETLYISGLDRAAALSYLAIHEEPVDPVIDPSQHGAVMNCFPPLFTGEMYDDDEEISLFQEINKEKVPTELRELFRFLNNGTFLIFQDGIRDYPDINYYDRVIALRTIAFVLNSFAPELLYLIRDDFMLTLSSALIGYGIPIPQHYQFLLRTEEQRKQVEDERGRSFREPDEKEIRRDRFFETYRKVKVAQEPDIDDPIHPAMIERRVGVRIENLSRELDEAAAKRKSQLKSFIKVYPDPRVIVEPLIAPIKI